MYVEHKAPGEVQITKLSQAIRIGALTVPESKSWSGCALGTAAKALGWNESDDSYPHQIILNKFPVITLHQLRAISHDHHYNHKTRLEIADELEKLGY